MQNLLEKTDLFLWKIHYYLENSTDLLVKEYIVAWK